MQLSVYASFIEKEISEMQIPIVMDKHINIDSRERCESLIFELSNFWRRLSRNVSPLGYSEFQNALLRCQLRSQNATSVRMIHQLVSTSELLFDMQFSFSFGFQPYDYEHELHDLHTYFSSAPKGFIRYPNLVPTGIYARHIYAENDIRNKRLGLASYEDIQRPEKFYNICITKEIQRLYGYKTYL